MKLAIFLISPYVALASALATVLWAYPSFRASQYRNELWRLRDRLLNEVAGGSVPVSDGAAGVLDLLEMLIATADKFNLRSGAAAAYALRHDRDSIRSAAAQQDDELVMMSAGLEAALDPKLRQYVLDARDLSVTHLARSSVLALVLTGITKLLAPAARRADRAPLGRRTIGTELVGHSELLGRAGKTDISVLAGC